MKITVLGAGMVGRAMAIDLSAQYEVTVADLSATNLSLLQGRANMTCIEADLRDKKELRRLSADCDWVVGAVPGFMGFETVKTVIECGRNIVDISFFPEDSLVLDELAREKGVVAITDMGVAPGMCNVILGYHHRRMKVDRYLCLVGGLPRERIWPWEYKAPFSPCDVIEEYVRPARYRENGALVTRPALSDPELINFAGPGTLEAWNSDGLRSLLTTMPDVPDMKEKTLRYPGYIEKVRILRDSGFFAKEPLDFGGHLLSPLEMTERILFTDRNWKLASEQPEFTVMRVIVSGEEAGVKKAYTYDLYDEYCTKTRTSSMARTTGYSATAALHAARQGLFTRVGLSPAEYLGEDEACFHSMLAYLDARNIHYHCRVRCG
jgi:saccharopine dehydrogenase-like NADP-dependent oxidoreductase